MWSLLCACSGCVLECVIEEGIGVVAAHATHGAWWFASLQHGSTFRNENNENNNEMKRRDTRREDDQSKRYSYRFELQSVR